MSQYNHPMPKTLRWRHNEWDGVSNHQPYDCLFKCLSGRRSKKTSKLRVTGLCAGNSPETGEFPAQMASSAETVSIWWRHHENMATYGIIYSLPYNYTGVDISWHYIFTLIQLESQGEYILTLYTHPHTTREWTDKMTAILYLMFIFLYGNCCICIQISFRFENELNCF